jgi:hypothetical protein
MKKGLHVIRLLWKGADCHLPPMDVPYGCPPKWSDYGESSLVPFLKKVEEEITARKFAEFHAWMLKALSAYYKQGGF